MNADRLFLDTAYALALLNRRDLYHDAARRLFERMRRAREVWTTEALLIKIGNSLARLNRIGAVTFIRSCYHEPNMRVVAVDTTLLRRAVQRYEERSDKSWGLTDCLSFEVMKDNTLTEALTADVHFEQAGYRILLSPS